MPYMDFTADGPHHYPLNERWRYYDSPEGVDLVTKLLATNSLSVRGAMALALFDVCCLTRPLTAIKAMYRVARIVTPAVGFATMFTTGAYVSCKIRGKDDPINYFAGGFACGPIWGVVAANGWQGSAVAVGLGIFAAIIKICREEGLDFAPKLERRSLGSPIQWKSDFSFIKEREHMRNWTSNPNEV